MVAGLESALIGERAIQGQVRQAYAAAIEHYRLSPSLNRLFQTAIHVGKRVRNEAQIATGAVSHSQVTVDILRDHGINLQNAVVAIIGVNKLTEDILKYLKSRGALNVWLSNRNYDKAQKLARQYGGTTLPLDRKRELLYVSDVVISATSAPHTIIRREDMAQGKTKKLFFDLAFPRDIDPEIALLPGIKLYNLEDIEAFGRRNITLRRNEISKAERIIDEELAKLYAWHEFKTKTLCNERDRKQLIGRL